MSMHGDTGGCLKLFSVQSREDSDIVIGSACGSDKTMVLIDHFNKMSNDEWDGLDSFEFFFRSELLSLEFDLVLFDVVFLDVEELQVTVEFLKFVVKVLLLGFG